MAKVLVSTISDPLIVVEIDLADTKWSSLRAENLPPFRIEELKRPCTAYPDGVFPGAESISDDKQVSRVHNFRNYIEFSKIVTDEVIPISGQNFLTTKYYGRRKEGWKAEEPLKKKGEVCGYCLNGDVYSINGKETVEKVFYGIVYRSLVQNLPAFRNLLKQLQDGVGLILFGADENFLTCLAEVLLISLGNDFQS